MRIWDVPPSTLCRQHLLGEHRELHALWSVIANDKPGYRNHPETKRWVGKLKALWIRHARLVEEMDRRGYQHATPLPDPPDDLGVQTEFVHTPDEQRELLRAKPCPCPYDLP